METTIQSIQDIAIAKRLFTEIMQGEKANKSQLFFHSEALHKFLGHDGYKVIRTDTSGRLSKIGSWSLDFGISGENDCFIHTSVENFSLRIPKSEHEYWLAFLVSLPLSINFMKGLLHNGCLDDGPIRKW